MLGPDFGVLTSERFVVEITSVNAIVRWGTRLLKIMKCLEPKEFGMISSTRIVIAPIQDYMRYSEWTGITNNRLICS